MLTVTTPASDLKLLSTEQMRAAAGLAADDSSRDAELAILNARISAEITDACRIAVANGKEPTLRQETLSEDFRGCRRGPLVLSRRHNVEIVSVTADGLSLAVDDYEIEAEAGLLHRLCGDRRFCWPEAKTIVVYKAGFATVPPALIGAAGDLIRFRRSELERDPLARSERVKTEGVDEVAVEYWVNAVTSGSAAALGTSIPPNVAASLARYRNSACG